MTIIEQVPPSNFFRTKFLRMKYDIRAFLGNYPALFFPANNYTKGQKDAVSNNTELVIEGFERSGNTFSVRAFKAAQSHPVPLASHLHVPAQVILAAHKGIPILVVIRNPVDAVLSWKALELEDCIRLSLPYRNLSMQQLFKHYIRFYTKIMPYQDKYVVGLFEEVTRDFGAVINKINQRFNTEFSIFDHNEDSVQNAFAQGGFHAGATSIRQQLKPIVRKEFEKQLESDKFKLLVSNAESVHQQFKRIA